MPSKPPSSFFPKDKPQNASSLAHVSHGLVKPRFSHKFHRTLEETTEKWPRAAKSLAASAFSQTGYRGTLDDIFGPT